MGENRISRVLLTGGSGLIGKALREQFQVRGWQCLRAVRKHTSSLSSSEVLWDPQKSQPFGQPEVLEGTDVVIHLSGENLLGKRWTPEFKRRIQSSPRGEYNATCDRPRGTDTQSQAIAVGLRDRHLRRTRRRDSAPWVMDIWASCAKHGRIPRFLRSERESECCIFALVSCSLLTKEL